MATNLGEILRVTLCGTIFTEEFCNVWFFLVSALTGTELDLDATADALEDVIIDGLTPAQTTELRWDRILIENISNNLDFHDKGITKLGQINTSEAMPSFNAFSVKFGRQTRETRNGYKRIPGLVESQCNGQELSPSTRAGLQSVVDTWDTIPVAGTNGGVITSIIMGRDADGKPELTRWQVPNGLTVQPDITTQTSRRKGRGS